MKRIILIVVVLAFFTKGFSQEIKTELGGDKDRFSKIMDDEFSDNYRLRFYNAVDGKPVKGAEIEIDNVGKFTTDREGKVEFPKIEDGNYNFGFSKDGFISCDMNFFIVEETIFYNQFSVCPSISLNAVRIILDWGKRPKDLDANLVKKDEYHISYRHTTTSADGLGKLDRDDRNGNGPETITIEQAKTSGEYTYFVTDFTNKSKAKSKRLSKSKAVVRVFGDNKLLKTFRLSDKSRGNKWEVFKIVHGKIVEINKIVN